MTVLRSLLLVLALTTALLVGTAAPSHAGATGACCTGLACSIGAAGGCASLGGSYQGDGTACTPGACGTVPRLNHFQCYDVRRPSAPSVTGVSLVDEFGAGTVEVRDMKRLCAPVNKNGEDPNAPSAVDHLVGYQIRRDGPRFEGVRDTTVIDQFGTLVLDVRRPGQLLVPAAKSLTDPATPLAPAGVDHYQCYDVRGDRRRVDGVTVEDQFGTGTTDVKRPSRLCLPVNKNGEGILDPAARLMCYDVRSGPRVNQKVFIHDQFGAGGIEVKRARELCVPGGCDIGGTFRGADTLDPNNPCQSCQPAVSTTAWTPVANGETCDDADACTQTDTCQAGVCSGSNPVTCTASDQCHIAGTCDPATGTCSDPAAPDETPCDDANACTQSDTCQAGACTGGDPVTCTASDQCHVAGTCDPATGTCADPAAPDETLCDDQNACTQTDTCQTGVCTGGNTVTCPASDQCHVAGTCDPATGACSNPAAPSNTPCGSPGGACVTGGTCDGQGSCIGGTAVDCDDGYSCTQDLCDPTLGCVNQGMSSLCNDGSTCTTDFCAAGHPDSDPQSGCLHTATNPGASCGVGNRQCDTDGNCVAGCLIESVPYSDGDPNPANPCQMCDPSRSEGTWSPALLGTVCRASTGVCDPVEVCNGVSEQCPTNLVRRTPKYRAIPPYESFDHCVRFSTGRVGYCNGSAGECQPLFGEACDKDCYVDGLWGIESDAPTRLICKRGLSLLPEGTYCGQALVNACVTKTCTHRTDEFDVKEAVCSPIIGNSLLPAGTVCEQEAFGVPGSGTPECKDECKCGGGSQLQCISTQSDAQLGDLCSQDTDCAFEQRCVDGQCATATTRAIGEACTSGDTEAPCSSGAFCCAYNNHSPVGQGGTCGNGCCADSECAAGRSCCAADGCVDFETDSQNCGACGNDCDSLLDVSACFSDATAACVGGQCQLSEAVATCAEGETCSSVTSIGALQPGDVIRAEGTTDDFTVITRTATQVFAEDAEGNFTLLEDVEFNYATCFQPEGILEEVKLNSKLCLECQFEADDQCDPGQVCQIQCDGSLWEILFCDGFGAAVGLCVPTGTVNACQ